MTDHNPLYAEFTLLNNVKKPEFRKEVFDFKDKECQKKFSEVISVANKFGSCFDPDRSVEQNVNKRMFLLRMNLPVIESFQKFNIT